MFRTSDEWIIEYQQNNALWIHDGNPKRPHALLTSGKHSNGFFNSRLVISDEVLLYDAASDLIELFDIQGGDIDEAQGVVGPQTGATKLAEFVSNQIMSFTRDDCFFASPAKILNDGKKSLVFHNYGKSLVRGSYVLLCEDVITTGGSVDLTIEAVDSVGGASMPFILTLVNRSGLTEISGREIISLIDRPMPIWTPEECPLCKQGSEAIRPKDNWDRLNARY
ncbi:MAG: hypothetical protein COV70_02340 [Parcubacteria group bacterium CG11_big_fil_rev_8_21_14_0_20_39_22]|nr:MAG: hypothetical protein COV70_02340 [Parcubacteria group bacterium CG11_big_fil_rev_8_21_14_0_20_39_22]